MKKYEQQTSRLEKISDFFGVSNFLRLNNYIKTHGGCEMRKLLSGLILSIGLACVVSARDCARVDIEGLSPRNSLTPESPMMHQNWRKNLKDFCITVNLYPQSPDWTVSEFSFTPEKSGKVKLLLLGNWISEDELKKRSGRWYKVYYRKVEVSGAEILNGDFRRKGADGIPLGWKLEGGSEYVELNEGGASVSAVLVRCYAPASTEIEVKAGVKVTVRVEYRPEIFGKPLNPAWILPCGSDIFSKMAEAVPQKNQRHPRLLFSEKDIPEIRKKAGHPYFIQYKKDLLATADFYLDKYPPDTSFPFRENPGLQDGLETLLAAYILSGDMRYGKRAVELSGKFISDHFLKVPVVSGGKFDNFLFDGNSVSFILRPLALTYDIMYNSLSDSEKSMMIKGLAYFSALTAQMASMPEYVHSLHKNYTAGQMGGLGLAALVLSDDIPSYAQDWYALAEKLTLRWNKEALYPDGMYPEGVTYYFYMCDNQLLFLEAMRRNGKGDFFLSTHLPGTLSWLTWSVLPWGGEIDNYGDGRYYAFSCRNLPQFFQSFMPGMGDYFVSHLQGDNLRYVHNPWAVVFGRKPELAGFDPAAKLGLGRCFPSGGMAAFTNAWNQQAVMLYAYATKYRYAAHSQADRGQFNLYGYGHKWAVDSGYGNDAKDINSATSPMAHNQVMIDGVGQAYDARMRAAGIDSHLTGYADTSDLGYVRFDLKPAYDSYVWYEAEDVRPWNRVRHADRHILYLRNPGSFPYVLVFDDIDKDGKAHDYVWRMHTSSANRMHIENGKIEIIPLKAQAEALSVGSVRWDNSMGNGFQVFRKDRISISFKVQAASSGKYYLWLKTSGRPFMDTCAELSVNGREYGRITPSYDSRPHWSRFSLNRKQMMEPEAVELNAGENFITLNHMLSGYWFYQGLLTTDAGFVPGGEDESFPEGTVVFGRSNLLGIQADHDMKPEQLTDASCIVRPLLPDKTVLTKEFFQPTQQPLQPCLNIAARAVNPEFLVMLFPSPSGTPEPEVSRNEVVGGCSIRLKWPEYTDIILVKRVPDKMCVDNITSSARLALVRFDNKGVVSFCFTSDGSELIVNGVSFRPASVAL